LIDVSNGGASALPVCSTSPAPGGDNIGGGGVLLESISPPQQ
jgi:hypothetical protein